MDNLLELMDGFHTVLDSNRKLTYDPVKDAIYLRVKTRELEEKVMIYSRKYRLNYLKNEVRDLMDTYFQFYYELMEETFTPYQKMNFHDVALGIATGMRIFHLYGPAFMEVRRFMNRHYELKEAFKPYGWVEGHLKYQENYQFIYQMDKNQFGLMIYRYDNYEFPEEVFHILRDEFKCIQKYPEKVNFENWKVDGWEYKEGA